ncbi:MAG: FISUMP domain-containing protein, partial [Bacteroidales bacterium]|nr:FISUMP domain-containing protein [Bacteroidales bacterium]
CWMAENLRYLPQVNGLVSSTNTTTPYYCIYDYNSSSNNIEDALATENYQRFGVLYNYLAASPNSLFCEDSLINVQGVCPTGWHLPSDNDWKELEISLGMNENSVNLYGWRGQSEGSALSGEYSLWTDGLLVSNVLFGESGFNAVPDGLRYNNNSAEINSTANYISSSKNEQNEYIKRSIYHNLNAINRYKSSSLGLISVRCLKNSDNTISLPYLTTREAQIITNDSIISGGIISSDGGSEIISRGVVWSRNQNPDLNSNEGYTIIVGQTGYFLSELTGLIQGETYYVRAYATNSLGTAYGNEIEFYTDICTPMYANILITQPPADSEGFINVCTNTELNSTDPVLFIATGAYPESGYPLSDESVLFKWKIDNNFVSEGFGMTNFETTFTAGQGHTVSLVIEDTAGCRSINDNTVRIRASLFGGFITDGCYTNPTIIEQGQPLEICANYITNEEWHSPILPTIQIDLDSVYLEDTSGYCYTSDLFIDQYPTAATIEYSGQLKSIGLNLVHTYIGDLAMYVQCPNGQEIQIGAQGGGGCNLGVPPMEAYWYEITSNASQTMQQAATSLTTLPAGQYLPFQSLDGLIGCPINGTWKLRICDNWSADEGYIYGWYLNFDTLNTNPWQYEITNNAQWSGNYGALISYPDSICTLATYQTTETPLVNSTQTFTFAISDNLGCSYDTTLFVTVLANNPADLPVVLTAGITDIYCTKAVCSGEVISEGNAPVSARGIVFGTMENPTIFSCSGFSTEIGGIGTFSSWINNLLPETEYYIRAYATNEFGTAYGEILSITTNAIPEILCPSNKSFCFEQDTVLFLNESIPVGGQYYIDGIEQTEINIQNLPAGIYTVTYLFEYEPEDTIDCHFNINISHYPQQVGIESSPTSGVISLTSLAYVYFEDSNIGDYYWVTFNDTIIGDTIYGNGYNQFSVPIHNEGCYTVYSSSMGGCVLLQDVVCFAINSGNKICVNTSLPNNEQFENIDDVKVKLFKEEIDNNQNTVIIQTAEIYPGSNNLAVFEDLESGDYYVESIIQNQSEYSEFQPVVFYKTATLSENALDVTLFGNTTKLLYIVHNPNPIQYGNNTANGSVGILIENNFTGIADKVVVLKNTSTDEILKITVTNQTGNYAFDTVPSDTEIEIFISDFEYPNWTAFSVITESNEDYVSKFIMIADSVHPYNPVSNLTSGKNLNNFDIIPNPAKDQIKILTDAEVTDIYIFDNNGKLIKRITENTNSEIEVNFLSPAVYYLTIVDKKGNIGVKKFVKQ